MEYRTQKLCSVRGTIYPAGTTIDIDDARAKELLALDAIVPLEAEAQADPDDAPAMDALNGEQFAQWLKGGAKVSQVIDWIGDDAERAEIAKVDERPTVQKRIDEILADSDDAGDEEE